MAQNVTEVFRATVPSVGLVLKARADIGGKQEAYCARIREDAENGVEATVETEYSANVDCSFNFAGGDEEDTISKDDIVKKEVVVTNAETGEAKSYLIPFGSRLKVEEGKHIDAGEEITEGSVDPHDLLRIKGLRAVQDYILREVQRVYRLQGVEINDKHIEVIVHQMLKKVRITESHDALDVLPGELMNVLDFDDMNERLVSEGKEPAEGTQEMLGITKASLATDSFMSAASFQETTRVLTDAAIKGKVDKLIGMKENVIIGKLIPAGTGMKRYRTIDLNTDAPSIGDAIDFDEKIEVNEDDAEEEMIETDDTAVIEEDLVTE